MGEKHRPGIAILASGGGSTAEAFIHATQEGIVDAEVGLVVCNNPPEKAGVYDRIDALNQQYGLDIQVEKINGVTHPGGPGKKGEQTLEEGAAIAELVHGGGFALVALMGYMKKTNGDLQAEYGHHADYTKLAQARMVNTHPGKLPETKGLHGIDVQKFVLEKRMPETAHTTHVVADDYDTGPIIAGHTVPVLRGDTPDRLFDRVQRIEKAYLPLDIGRFLELREKFDART